MNTIILIDEDNDNALYILHSWVNAEKIQAEIDNIKSTNTSWCWQVIREELLNKKLIFDMVEINENNSVYF